MAERWVLHRLPLASVSAVDDLACSDHIVFGVISSAFRSCSNAIKAEDLLRPQSAKRPVEMWREALTSRTLKSGRISTRASRMQASPIVLGDSSMLPIERDGQIFLVQARL